MRKRVTTFLMIVLIPVSAFMVLHSVMQMNGWRLIFDSSHGQEIGKVNAVNAEVDHTVTIYSANGASERGKYGLEFQCVELVNRYYTEVLGHKNMTRTGHADSYYWDASTSGKNLQAFPNGGSTKPEKHDILIFDEGPNDGKVGHVAVVVLSFEGGVFIIQQNYAERKLFFYYRYIWNDVLRVREENGNWFIESENYPSVAGWSRPMEK